MKDKSSAKITMSSGMNSRNLPEVIAEEVHLAVYASTPMAPSHLRNHAQATGTEDAPADEFPIAVA